MVKNIIIFIFLIFIYESMSAQKSIYLMTGKNYTDFKYENSAGIISNGIQNGIGDSYDLGIKNTLFYEDSPYSWDLSINLNEYNSSVGTKSTTIKWQTQYLGIENSFSYSFIDKDKYNISAKVGANLGKIVYGKEEIDGIFYDIRKTDDFKSVLFQYTAGVNFQYLVSETISINIGYRISNSLNNTKETGAKFYLKTSQIGFGIYIEVYN